MAEPFFVAGGARTDLFGREEEAAAHFAETRTLLCPGAIETRILARLMDICARAEWRSDPVVGLGHRCIEKPATAGGAISLLLRRGGLFRWLERVTRCAPIDTVEGRVVQTEPAPDDRLVWHDDIEGCRRLAITINLGDRPYEGGLFELRDKASGTVLMRHHHTLPGQALIFEVATRSEHRVLPLASGGPRRVYTGWFVGASAS